MFLLVVLEFGKNFLNILFLVFINLSISRHLALSKVWRLHVFPCEIWDVKGHV